jgi:hypothetical protein
MKKVVLSVTLLVAGALTSPLFAQITDPSPYCNGSFDDMDGTMDVPDQINKVSFGTLSNASNAQSPLPHYIFYTNLPQADFTKDSTYTLNVNFDVHGAAGYGVWIDYNHDNDFSNDEKVSGSDGTNFLAMNLGTIITENVTIPATAINGTTRMRVRIVEDDQYTGANGADISPCNAGTSTTDVMDWGETEDYNINIVGSVPNGINELNNNPSFSIHPNPVQSTLAVDTKLSRNCSYNIYDITGKSILTGSLAGYGKIDVSGLNNGIYLIRFFDKEKALGQYKFIKGRE